MIRSVSSPALAGLVALVSSAGLAAGQFVPAAGPGTGQVFITHANAANNGNSAVGALPVFDVNGVLLTAGNAFPILGPLGANNTIAVGLTPNVPVSLITPGAGPLAIPGINAASTTVVGVGGQGRFGLITPTLPNLDIGVVPNGGLALNAFGGSVDYVNAGPVAITTPVVAFTSGSITLANPGVDFGVVSIRTRIDVGFGVGNNFLSTSSAFLNDIIIRFDGAGGRTDDVLADVGIFLQPNANTLGFAVASVGAFLNILPGQTVRVSAAQTLLGDPVSFAAEFGPGVTAPFNPDDLTGLIIAEIQGLGLDPNGPILGFGASSFASGFLPAPSAAGAMGLAGLIASRRRRA